MTACRNRQAVILSEQVNGKSNNIEDLNALGKKIIQNGKILDIMPKDKQLHVI